MDVSVKYFVVNTIFIIDNKRNITEVKLSLIECPSINKML